MMWLESVILPFFRGLFAQEKEASVAMRTLRASLTTIRRYYVLFTNSKLIGPKVSLVNTVTTAIFIASACKWSHHADVLNPSCLFTTLILV